MSTTRIGAQFEKYVRWLLHNEGLKTRRNVMFHRGDRIRQIDVDYKSGLIFRKHVIVECKYVRPGTSVDFYSSYVQLGGAILFTRSDEGILATNVGISHREEKEDRYHIRIYDQEVLLRMRYGRSRHLDSLVCDMEQEIRQMPYNPSKDHAFIHEYV